MLISIRRAVAVREAALAGALVLWALGPAAMAQPARSTSDTRASDSPLADDLRRGFEARLAAVADALDGVLGYAIVDLKGGQRFERLADEPFPTASTIKLAVLYELLRQADEGRVALDRPSPLDRRQVVAGSGILQHLQEPVLSLRDHATLMMILSDNSATNVVIDAVGMDRVNARMDALGAVPSRLRRRMMDVEAARRGDENVASPGALARMASLLWSGEGLSESAGADARRILERVGGQIRRAVPARVPVFSKTGSLAAVRAEAAVVDLEGRPFAIAVMTTYLASDSDGDRAILRIAEAAFSYFERLARGGAYGRQ
jgi:beta-lactamase class A